MANIKLVSLDMLSVFKGKMDTSVDTKVNALKNGQVATNAADITGLKGRMTTVEGVADKNKTDIAAIKADYITQAKLDAAVNALATGQVATNTAAIAALQQQVDTLPTGDDVDGKISAAIAAVVDGAPESFDTLKEIATWIQDDKTGAAAMSAKITKNSQDIAALQGRMTTAEGDIDAVEGRLDTVEGKINTLKTTYATKEEVATAKGEAINAAEQDAAAKYIPLPTAGDADKVLGVDGNGDVQYVAVASQAEVEALFA